MRCLRPRATVLRKASTPTGGVVAQRVRSCRIVGRQRRRVFRPKSTMEGYAMANGAPFESPRGFYSKARDLMVNGFDLIEELSEVTIEPPSEGAASTPKVPEKEIRTVSYFGSTGAFCEEAAAKVYPSATLRPVASWGGTIDDLLRGDSDRAVVPIENYIMKRTRILYDLICKYDLHIVDEVFLNIEHALLAKPGTKTDDVKIVASHIQALFQCEQFVVSRLPKVRLERMNDTAVAARMAAEYPTNDMAAIASRACAERYGLAILQDAIQDRSDNVTRFVVLGRHPAPPDPSERSKTSILFGLPEDRSSGTLGRALEIFASHGINLLWLDSRELHSPLTAGGHAAPCNYLFYINLDGSVKDPKVKEALDQLEGISTFFRLIGSYRMHARYLEDFVPQ